MGKYDVEEIQKKKSLIGGKISYHFNGLSYETLEEAEHARSAEIRRMEDQKKADEIRDKLKSEMDAEYAAAVNKYNDDPEYATFYVTTQPIRDKKSVWFGLAEEDTNLASIVDMQALSDGISDMCRHCAITGYEVISIVPTEAGVGAYTFPGGKVIGGAGWGYSFTQGVVITAKKVRR